MARPGLLLYFDLVPALEKLPPASVGELLLAALHYAREGTEPTFEETALEFAWAFLRPSIDRDGEAYESKRQRGDWLVYCRGCKKDGAEPLSFEDWKQRSVNDTLRRVDATLPTTTTTTTTTSTTTTDIDRVADKPPTHPKFTPPTVEEVAAYVQERGSRVEPQVFVDYYASKGWMIGKTPMKDWKAACRNAEKWDRWQKQTERGKNDAGTEGPVSSKYKLEGIIL